jgi:hypothetical protein
MVSCDVVGVERIACDVVSSCALQIGTFGKATSNAMTPDDAPPLPIVTRPTLEFPAIVGDVPNPEDIVTDPDMLTCPDKLFVTAFFAVDPTQVV